MHSQNWSQLEDGSSGEEEGRGDQQQRGVVAAFVYQIQVLSLTFNTLSGTRPVMSCNVNSNVNLHMQTRKRRK